MTQRYVLTLARAGLVALFCLSTTGLVLAQSVPQTLNCSATTDSTDPAVLAKLSALVTYEAVDLTADDKSRFERVLCASARATRALVNEKGLSADWLVDLPVIIKDYHQESNFEASFNRALVESPARSIVVTSALVRGISEEELLWVLGHEMGHGVFDDGFLRKFLGVAWAMVVAVGAILTLATLMTIKDHGVQRISRFSAASVFVLLVLAGPVTYVGATSLGHRVEFRADAFGLEVTAHSVGSRKAARKTAIALLERRNSKEQDFLDVFWEQSAHPSSVQRARALRDLQ